MDTIESTLGSDHGRCDQLFTDAEAAVCDGDWARGAERFAAFNDAIERHFKMEEEVLFPEFESATGTTAGPTEVMRSEHVQMRGLLYRMAAALEQQDQDEYLGHSETLLILMQQHNAKEEQMLYPMADQVLGPKADGVLQSMETIA